MNLAIASSDRKLMSEMSRAVIVSVGRSCVAIALVILLSGCSRKTQSVAATPEQIAELGLPSTARDVQFYSSTDPRGAFRVIVFKIDEAGFRTIYREHALVEISPDHPQPYVERIRSFTPWRVTDATATHGLSFESYQENGGGLTLVFDRDRQSACYWYQPR
jgi:hypothetical protein